MPRQFQGQPWVSQVTDQMLRIPSFVWFGGEVLLEMAYSGPKNCLKLYATSNLIVFLEDTLASQTNDKERLSSKVFLNY